MQLWRKDRDVAPERAGRTARRRIARRLFACRSQRRRSGFTLGRARTGSRHAPGPRQGSGSGTILSPDGLVLTNNHVVEGASAIELALPEADVAARLLGRDADTDIAVLRAETSDRLPAGRLGNSKKVRPGQVAVAIGNPFGFEFDGDGRHRQRRRPLAARPERPPDRRRHTDRCRAQPGQLRRAAGELARRGDRRQHGRHHGRAGHLFFGCLQHRAARADADSAARPRAPRAARHRRRSGAAAAADQGGHRPHAGGGRARRGGAARQPRRRRRWSRAT